MTKTASAAESILDNIGGAENISSMTHCATRLRMQLHDRSAADVEKIDAIPEVLGVVPQGTNGLQVIMGGGVANYYQALMKMPGMDSLGDKEANRQPEGESSEKKEYGGVRGKYSWVDYSFEFLSDTFRPILWALLGASLIITLLVVADRFGIQPMNPPEGEELPPTWAFLHAMYNSVFYFIPIMVGATAARKLGANEWVGAAIPAAFLTPDFLSLGDQGDSVVIFGIPMLINNYAGQVFPPLFAAIVLYWVEKGLKKIIPEFMQMVFVPFFSLLIMIPLTGFIIGRFGIIVGESIAQGLFNLNDFSPFILAIVIPLIYPFMVPLGLHWPLNAIMIQNISVLGYDFIQGPMGAWNFACFGVAAGVLVLSWKEKNQQMGQVATGGLFAGLLGGISEPSLYGIVLRFKKTYFRLLPACLVGGIVMGIFNVKANAFVFTSVLTVFAFDPLGGYVIGITAAFMTSMLLVIFFDYRSPDERVKAGVISAADAQTMGSVLSEPQTSTTSAQNKESAQNKKLGSSPSAHVDSTVDSEAQSAETHTQEAVKSAPKEEKETVSQENEASGEAVAIFSPLDGELIDLADVPDPAFSSGAVGKGVAIQPQGDTVYAPGDGKILAVQGHAIGIRLDSGVDVLVHVGVDTVEMKGEGFNSLVSRGDRVEKNQPLMTFDIEAITAAGYPSVTPVLVTNHRKWGALNTHEPSSITHGERIISISPKEPKASS